MKYIFKIILVLSIFFLIAISVLPSYAMSLKTDRNDVNNGFKYGCEIYKSAAIITWNRSLDSMYCVVYSKDRQRSFNTFSTGNAKNRRTFVIPLKHFDSADFPLTAIMHFYGSNFNCSDSITINY